MINNKYNAIGIVEISFYTNALIVLDEMLKTSEVALVHWEKLLGGRMVSLIVGGDTSAVQSAIDTAVKMGSRVGEKNIKIAIAIPSPHPQIMKLFTRAPKKHTEQEQIKEAAVQQEPIKQETVINENQPKTTTRRKKK